MISMQSKGGAVVRLTAVLSHLSHTGTVSQRSVSQRSVSQRSRLTRLTRLTAVRLSAPPQNVILSSQSAATVKKDSLIQPALEVQDTSSQESSLESESDDEDDYMDM